MAFLISSRLHILRMYKRAHEGPLKHWETERGRHFWSASRAFLVLNKRKPGIGNDNGEYFDPYHAPAF